jgi:hypothetical protein
MDVLTTSTGAQSITVIPRFEPTSTVRVTLKSDDQNAQQIQSTVTGTYSNGYLTVSLTFDADDSLTEGQFYSLKIEESIASVWTMAYRGLVYCTDQTDFPKYTINSGKFTEYAGNDNAFLTI